MCFKAWLNYTKVLYRADKAARAESGRFYETISSESSFLDRSESSSDSGDKGLKATAAGKASVPTIRITEVEDLRNKGRRHSKDPD